MIEIVKAKLLLIRKSKGMSQVELAQKLKVSQSAVAKWETGETNPRLDMLGKIAAVLECSIEELIGGE